LLENEIENEKSFVLTKDHLEILDKERELHLNGVTDSYSKQEAFDIIKGIKVL